MKRLLYITILLGVILMSAVSSLKWRQISDVVTTLTEINYLHGITGKPLTRSSADSIYNQIANNINPHDSVYYKDESDSRYAPQINANLTNPTVTTQPAGDNSTKAASTAFVARLNRQNDLILDYISLGANIKYAPMFAYAAASSAVMTMVDGTAYSCLIDVTSDFTTTGVGLEMGSPTGNYTADNWNGFVLFSLSGTAMTEVGRTADTPNLWKTTANTLGYNAFTSPISLTAGKYLIVGVWNASATTAPPVLATFGTTRGMSTWASGVKPQGTLASQATIPSSLNLTSFSASINVCAFWLY